MIKKTSFKIKCATLNRYIKNYIFYYMNNKRIDVRNYREKTADNKHT